MTTIRAVPVLLAALLCAPAPAAASDGPDAERLLASPAGDVPGTIAGFRRISTFRQDFAIRFLFAREGADPTGANVLEVLLTRRDDTRPAFRRTRSYDVSFRGPMVDGEPAPEARPLVDAVVQAVTRNDTGDSAIEDAPFVEKPDSPELAAWTVFNRVTVDAGLLMVAAFLALLPVLARRLWGDLRSGLGRGAWLVAGLAAAGLTLRLALPHVTVMYYMGYRLAHVAATMDDVTKYGPAALALYHLLFLATGTSHLAMAWLNSVAGGLLPIPLAALVLRCGAGRTAAIAVAAFAALTPLFVRDATTESLLVPATLWMVAGLAVAARARATRSPSDLSIALLLLTLATWARPEAVLLVPLTAALLAWQWPADAGRLPRWTLVAWAVAAALLAARIAHLAVAIGIERARGNSPVLADADALLALPAEHLARNLAFWPSMYPAGLTVLAALGLVAGGGHRALRTLAALAAAAAWLTVSFLDLPYVSLPRVQSPGLLLVTVAAAWGAEGVAQRLWKPGFWTTARRILLGICAACLLASMAETVPALWQRTNADDEEDLLRDAVVALPDGPAVLVRRSYDDQPVERIHLFYPDYVFEPPARDGVVVGPDRFETMAPSSRPAFFLLGTRCYLRQCGAEGMHPACTRMIDRWRLEPVIEREVPVRRIDTGRPVRPDQDLDFPWCISATGSMKLGLYRIAGPRSRDLRPRTSDL
jgi:hypothetical protein